MSNRIALFIRLPWSDKRTLFAAYGLLARAYWALRREPFARLRSWTEAPLHAATRPAPGNVEPTVERISRWVSAAASYHFLRIQCLERSLVLQRLLAGAGVPSELKIGIEKVEGRLHAHAWVEVDGRPISEPEAIEARFRPFAAYLTATKTSETLGSSQQTP